VSAVRTAIAAVITAALMFPAYPAEPDPPMTGSGLVGLYDRFQYLHEQTEQEELYAVAAHIMGMLQGWMWANAELVVARKEAAMFCAPKDRMTLADVIEIVRAELQDDPDFYLGKTYGAVLFYGLKHAFPCT
jgi:hypothetical protein